MTKRKALLLGVRYLVFILISIVMFFPIYWMIACSFMTRSEVVLIPPHIYPHAPTFKNFVSMIGQSGFLRYTLNSIYIVAISTVVSVFTSVIGGYILAKFNFKGKMFMFIVVMATTMIPFQTYMVPLYIITQRVHLLNTYAGIMMPLFVTSFGIFFMRQNIFSLPNDYIDAARIDGAGEWKIFSSIIVPMQSAAISALTVFQFMFGWKFFIWPLIVTDSSKKFTLEIGLQIFATKEPLDYQMQMAGAVLGMLPILAVYLVFRKRFVNGIVLTGIK